MTDFIFLIFYSCAMELQFSLSRLPFNSLEKDNRIVRKDCAANKSALQATLFHKFSFCKQNDVIASYDIQRKSFLLGAILKTPAVFIEKFSKRLREKLLVARLYYMDQEIILYRKIHASSVIWYCRKESWQERNAREQRQNYKKTYFTI